MKITKINCASCGAPLTIPEDTDVIVCPACHSTLAIERSEGYITLKVMEKLAESIKENAYVTQVELKRMQLNQLISMEEMKINSLQAEIRAVKRRIPPGVALDNELSELLQQDCITRMRIRSLKADIVHLDTGWEESLEVIQKDAELLMEAIKVLIPYGHIPMIKIKIQQLRSEKSACDARYNGLEDKLLRRELQSIKYPAFDDLTLVEMEELLEKIPSDLEYLYSKPQTNVNIGLQDKLNNTLKKINANYPRMKVESQTGELTSLDLQGPYPEEPAKLKFIYDQVNEDLEKVIKIESCVGKDQLIKILKEKLNFLKERADADIPGKRAREKAKKRKRRRIILFTILGVAGVGIILCLTIFLFSIIGADSGKESEKEQNVAVSNRLEEQATSNASDQDQAGEYQPYSATFVEVTASVTYLRVSPSFDATVNCRVNQGDVLINIDEESLPDSWYKVSTLDGSMTGYLAIDWISPITVNSVPGETLKDKFDLELYDFDFSSMIDEWPSKTFHDETLTGSSYYSSETFHVDVTSKESQVNYHIDQTIQDLPEEYSFSIALKKTELSGTAYYGIHTNVIDENNYDAVLIDSQDMILLYRVRNGTFTLLYDTSSTVNTMMPFEPDGENTISVIRLVDSANNTVTYQYAVNGKVFVEMILTGEINHGSAMGIIIYLEQNGDHAEVQIDDFTVKQ